MFHDNSKPLKIIGYPQGTVTQEIYWAATQWAGKETLQDEVEIISPQDFLEMSGRDCFQYCVAFNRDLPLKLKIINLIEVESLNCPSVIIQPCLTTNPQVSHYIGQGTWIAPFCTFMNHCKVGRFCIIEPYSMISHYTVLGDNVHLHPGSMIAGKTRIGNNVIMNFRASVLNGITICDNVEIGAGSMVTKDITVAGRYVGTPARRVGDIIEVL